MTLEAITQPITAITHRSRHRSRPLTLWAKSQVERSRIRSRRYTFRSRFAGSFRNPRKPDREVVS